MKRCFERNPYRELPDGTITRVYPFHVSLQGLEARILCREDSDYDAFVKFLCLSARRRNVILVIYAVVSNHSHCVILADSQNRADAFGEEVKRMFSMYFSKKYGDRSVMQRTDVKAIWLDSDYYLRNAIAYVVRNAMDNGARSIQNYKWTGFRAMFCDGRLPAGSAVRSVAKLSKRDMRRIMHTGDRLYDVRWMINADDELEPVSICDWKYVQDAFLEEQSFFMRLVGGVNTGEMSIKLVDAPRAKRTDGDLLISVNEISQRWFKTEVHNLTLEKKARLLQYIHHCFKTDPSQLARTFEIGRETVVNTLGKKRL
ncbi:MAG: hypothetical protein IKN31_00020 [Bacteroidales bacterium]|nr:hypothetical protein [Bacteroidales bacterium]